MVRKRFLPWVGPEYHSEQFKILVLGESHHSDGKRPAGAPTASEIGDTISLTQKFIDGENKHAFWTKVGTLVAKFMGWTEDNTAIDAKKAFERIAFYNFLTSAVSGHRDRPSSEAVVESRPAFIEVIDELVPDLVIALGVDKQTWFLRDIAELEYLQTGEKPYVARRGNTAIVVCNHPQGRFSYDEAIRLLNAGMAIVEAKS